MTEGRNHSWERTASIILGVLIAVGLIAQTRVLYEFPQPDSSRWWGDETGQMLELRTELQDGYARIPTALGSSVAITNGLVRGNSWLAAIMYGVPTLLFSHFANVVEIGRTITFLLSLLLLFAMYRAMRRFGTNRIIALLVLLILISTRNYFFSTHAARLDVAASIAVVLLTWYCAAKFEQYRIGTWDPSLWWYAAIGAAVLALATLSIHLLTLLPLITIYCFWKLQAYRRPLSLLAAITGALVVAAMLFGIYSLSGAPVSVFGPSAGNNQFHTVASNLPVLRPFSRSVQVANILERVHGLWSEAPTVIVFAFITLLFSISRKGTVPKSLAQCFTLGASIVILLAWLLFESPALYYYVQVLPIFLIAMAFVVSNRLKIQRNAIAIIILCAGVLSYFGIADVLRASATAKNISKDNGSALQTAVEEIESENGNKDRPIVLAQNPAIAVLEYDSRVRLMTAHLVSFPISNEPLAATLQKLKVQYLLLYAPHDSSIYSDDYAVLRPLADSIGTVVFRDTGILFDVHRDYFMPQSFAGTPDTLILYKLPFAAR